MTKLLVWPDGTYLDADEYNEVEFNHKGEDLITLDLQDIVDGRTALVYTGSHVELVLKGRQSELLQVEHQFKALTEMYRNYRNTMREYTWQIPQLRETIENQRKDYALALRKITELETSSATREEIASKDQEIKTILQARDQWVKELQGKLIEATRLLNQSEEVNEELENRIAILNAQPPSPAFQGDLAEENRRLKSQLAGATARIRKTIDGYGTDWRAKAEAAEAELAKAVEISDTMEDQIERMRIQLNAAEDKAIFCAKERDECAAKVDSLEVLLSELYQVLGALDAPAKVLDLVTKVLDGHGFDPETDSLLPFYIEVQPIRPEDDWEYRARTAESELAKLKETSAISSDIEDNLRKERDRLGKLLDKHGVCTGCGDMFEHHEDEPFASCSCQTSEWPEAPQTPYMLMQRRVRELEESNAEDESFAVQELKGEIAEMKRIAAFAIATLQEIE